LEQGREALDRRDDILILSRTGKLLRREIQPNRDLAAPRIFPIEASIYLSPEIERLVEDTAEELVASKGPSIKNEEAKDALLAEIADPLAAHFDTLFLQRFFGLAEDWRVYRVQQMEREKRREYLHEFHYPITHFGRSANARQQTERTLDQLEKQYMAQKFPERGPPSLAFETVLDFEAAVVVSVSRERLKKDATAIRNRFALYLLSLAIPGGLRDTMMVRLPAGGLGAMAEAGIITDEEFEQFRQAKTERQRVKVLQNMWRKYYKLSWRSDYEPPHIYKVPLTTSPKKAIRKKGTKVRLVDQRKSRTPPED
jgi:hypothetical protein